MNSPITDTYIINNIISYVNIDKQIFINKYFYNKSKQQLKKKVQLIEKFYIKHKIRLEMLFEYLEYENVEAIRNYYILFYPKEFRQSFINSAIIHFNSVGEPLNLINNSDNPNAIFINLIKKLSVNELAWLGW